jgi:hypothetical protein
MPTARPDSPTFTARRGIAPAMGDLAFGPHSRRLGVEQHMEHDALEVVQLGRSVTRTSLILHGKGTVFPCRAPVVAAAPGRRLFAFAGAI